jgi:predicted PurR-regulated permease PerM
MDRWGKYAATLVPTILVIYLARSVLAPFILAIATAYVISPLVDHVQARLHIARAAVVGLFYLVFFGTVTLAVLALEPTVARQSRDLFDSGEGVSRAVVDRVSGNDQMVTLLRTAGVDIVSADDPQYLEKRETLSIHVQDGIDKLTTSEALGTAAQTTFHLMVDFVIWASVTFYLTLNERKSIYFFFRFIPDSSLPRVREVMARIHVMLWKYLRGQIALVSIMSVSSYVVLRIFQVPHALPLAIGTGLVEIVPFVGPILAATVAGLVALTTNGVGTMIGVLVSYLVLRQVEDQIVMPQIVGRVVHLNPVVTIFVVLAGEHIGGIIGVLIAIPLAAAARVVLDEVFPEKTLVPPPSLAEAT